MKNSRRRTLKYGKVILRPITLSDAPRFVRWLGDPEVNKYTIRRRVTLKEERKWIKNLRKEKSNYVFAIDTGEGHHIGSADIRVSEQNHYGSIGIIIGDKTYWNRGYGTDAMKTIIRFGFDRLKLNRIDLDTFSYNLRAIHVYKKLGFRVEGIRRQRVYYKRKYFDEIEMGLLKSEQKFFV